MDDIEQLANLFKALSDPTRLRLIHLLYENPGAGHGGEGGSNCPPPQACEGQGFLCVNALAHRLGVSQSAVSQHLRILRHAGLVRGVRHGSFMHYSIDPEGIARFQEALGETLGPHVAA
jgi:DNA-binding transcriptional ArsR family regulator